MRVKRLFARVRGYLFARPCPAAEIEPLLRKSLALPAAPRLRAA
jgi:hypothetical protein